MCLTFPGHIYLFCYMVCVVCLSLAYLSLACLSLACLFACLFICLYKSSFGQINVWIKLSRGMRVPTMWYVRPAKAQTSLRIRAV